MDRLDQQVRRELRRFGPVAGGTQSGDIVAIVRAWPGAVGETVARNAWPARFARDGTLHVNTASATWAFELGRLAATILEQLRPELGEATPAGAALRPRTDPGARGGAGGTACPDAVPRSAPSTARRRPGSPPESRTRSCASTSRERPLRASLGRPEGSR